MTATDSTGPTSVREVREFLAVELPLNDEWQAACTVRLLRYGQWLYRNRERGGVRTLGWKVWVLAERVWFHTLLGADLPATLEVGLGVRFAHGGRGVVMHPRVRLGKRCTVYHSVTVGLRGDHLDVPTIGDDVTLAAGCVVLGGVQVGEGAAVGANAVVIADVPERCHVVAASSVQLGTVLELPPTRATASGRKVPRA